MEGNVPGPQSYPVPDSRAPLAPRFRKGRRLGQSMASLGLWSRHAWERSPTPASCLNAPPHPAAPIPSPIPIPAKELGPGTGS